MLWLCLFFPSLPLDVFARAQSPQEQAQPLVVTTGGHYPRVVAANAAARAAGIRAEQLVSGALALAPELVLRTRDEAAEAHALAQLATGALQFTPMACLAPPNAIVAEIGGSLRLFGGLPRLVARLVGHAHALGYSARLGNAPTPRAALLFARGGETTPITDVARLPAALAPLPLALLDIDEATRATLRDAGITTFGQAAALPRAGLARRFGAALVRTLDRTLGTLPDPQAPFVPPPCFTSRLDLPASVHDVEALGFGVQRLVRELSGWLTARGLGIVRLVLTLGHERHVRQRGIPATAVPFALAAPARAPEHLLAVLRERLARVELPAAVETIALASEETAPLSGHNLGLLPGDEAAGAPVPLLDRLRARLGEDAVLRLALHAEHRPERAMREATPAEIAAHAGRAPKTNRRRAQTAAHAAPPLSSAERPIWLLAEPQPIAHLLESQPWALRDGPERIESGWWDGADLRRDYFVASAAGGETVWIYRDHRYSVDDGEWFLHGLFA